MLSHSRTDLLHILEAVERCMSFPASVRNEFQGVQLWGHERHGYDGQVRGQKHEAGK